MRLCRHLGAAVALMGCGGPEVPAFPTGAALERLVADCGLPERRAAASGERDPAAGFLPRGARLVESRPTGRAHRALAVIGAPPGQAVIAAMDRAREEGFEPLMREDEGFESDAALARDGTVVLIKAIAGSCANASRMTITVAPRS